MLNDVRARRSGRVDAVLVLLLCVLYTRPSNGHVFWKSCRKSWQHLTAIFLRVLPRVPVHATDGRAKGGSGREAQAQS